VLFFLFPAETGSGIKYLVINDEKTFMSDIKGCGKDKRKHDRQSAKHPARLKISLSSRDSGKILQGIQSVIAMAETKNISIGGMSLKIVGSPFDARRSLTPANAAHVVGRPIEVVLENDNIIIWGDVIRTESDTLELAIVIYKVSDVQEWKKLCSQKTDGLSIFPDSLAVRRKRRA
jgi:hypothetical protein